MLSVNSPSQGSSAVGCVGHVSATEEDGGQCASGQEQQMQGDAIPAPVQSSSSCANVCSKASASTSANASADTRANTSADTTCTDERVLKEKRLREALRELQQMSEQLQTDLSNMSKLVAPAGLSQPVPPPQPAKQMQLARPTQLERIAQPSEQQQRSVLPPRAVPRTVRPSQPSQRSARQTSMKWDNVNDDDDALLHGESVLLGVSFLVYHLQCVISFFHYG